jgi:hypothetical protein
MLMPFSSTFTFPMHHKRTRMGQYYSTRAVFPAGKVKKQSEPRKNISLSGKKWRCH